MRDVELFNRIGQVRESFKVACKKLCGAVTTEILRAALKEEKLNVSPRDVYVRGVGFEFDLLVLRPGAKGEMDLIFEPSDVLAVIEVKNYGVFGEDAADGIRRCFAALQAVNSGVAPRYVTVAEQLGYKHRITSERLGFPAYTLFSRKTKNKEYIHESTGDWERLLADLRAIASQN